MAAARRHGLQERTLEALQIQYQNLPHQNVRWNTAPGQEFLTALAVAVDTYGRRAVAEGLGRSLQGIDYMLNRRRLRNPDPYPSAGDLIDLLMAWRVVQAISDDGKIVHRYDLAYVPMHRALMVLMSRYDVGLIALAAHIPLRKLKRFQHPPMVSPPDVAQVIQQVQRRQ